MRENCNKEHSGLFKGLKQRLKHNRLGALLVQDGIISEGQLKAALKRQRQEGIQLGDLLLQENIITRNTLFRVLFEQWAFRSAAATITVLVSLACFAPGKARAASVKDVAGTMIGAEAPNYSKFSMIKVHPRIFGTVEKKSANINPFHKWTGMFDRFEDDLRSSDNQQTMSSFLKRVKEHKNKSLYDMARSINTLVNSYRYSRDSNVWGKSDYWATPVEFLQRGGDCEDFAIAKYAALRANGVPEDRLRVAIVHDNYKDIPHAVLIVYTERGPIMLDNQAKDITHASSTERYKPIFSINRHAWWLHEKATGPTVVASIQ